ncbi:UNVERIFIED_CONTAM: TonB-dependent receptor, partial [Bacteroidetes bacterium 56_B9]
VSGNNNIPADQTSKIFGVAEQKKWLNITDTWWTAGTTLNNEKLKWESTYSANIGLDFGFFNNKLNGSLDLYKNNTKDLLMEFSIMGS